VSNDILNLPSSFLSALNKLEYYNVLEQISHLAISESGRQQVHKLLPLTDKKNIELELKKVSEAKELLISDGTVPFDGFKNILPSLKKSTVENQALTVVELLEISAIIRISRSLKTFLSKRLTQYPSIYIYHNDLFVDKIIEHHINEALDEHGFVKDTASRGLREIRRSMVAASDDLRKRLESILRQISQKEFLQEDIITTRDGRFVIPIKTEYKNQVPGFIHSTSASGATVFIEPAESLELNNVLRELQLREQREIHRILIDLTKEIAGVHEFLEKSFKTLIELDVIFAKAKYSIKIIGNAPQIAEEPSIRLFNARHPVLLHHLKMEQVIPLSIELGCGVKTLIITGPNAGGKTVAMKTIGLMTLCAQTGIHIPADSESEIFPFKNIFVDIGDDQSIENDLSTFSSHLISLREILKDADKFTLILIDEIGAGTDPSEGGALGAVVLKELTNRESITITTTHHSSLKMFAHETDGISNASMEFNQDTLRPTYHFKCGIPGSSYAFELAERLGIPKKYINESRTIVGNEKVKLESLLVELEHQSQNYQRQLREVSNEKRKLESSILSYEQKMTVLKRELGTIKRKATEEAKEIVLQAHMKVEHSIKEIRESGANKEVIKASRHVLKQLGDELQKITTEEPEKNTEVEKIEKGDFVRIRDGHEQGEVFEVYGKYAFVLSGNTKVKIALSDLHKEKKATSISISATTIRAFDAKNEIDIRGLFGDEAIDEVQKFLDDAYSAGLHRVDIIHGKGTEALRKKIGEFIKNYPHIKTFRLGEWNEGGTGVTVVELN
jgi:DNA mismatch repair protein MutS2